MPSPYHLSFHPLTNTCWWSEIMHFLISQLSPTPHYFLLKYKHFLHHPVLRWRLTLLHWTMHTWGDPIETRLVSRPPNAEEWEKDNVSASSLDPQLSVARRTSSCNNFIGRTVSFREGSFCDPVEIVMSDLKEQRTCLKFCCLLGKTPTESLEMLQEAFKEQALSRAPVF